LPPSNFTDKIGGGIDMSRIRVDEIFGVLRNTNQFYSVEFERRTDRPDGTAPAGTVRRMLCRTAANMNAYKLGVISDEARDEQDFRCAVLTVWSVDAYHQNRRNGMSHENAAFNAWRRIDLTTVTRCSAIPSDDLPPDILANLHEITNAYRLANMPREPLTV
jgi:hypothetical protein